MDEDTKQQPEQNIDALQNDLDTITNNWKRTLADFENYKRRKEAENKELVEFAREVAVAKLLPVLDSLGQALRHMPEMNEELRMQNAEFGKQYQNWQSGISGIVIQLDQALGELGVKKIEAVGKKFDPNFHEAIREVESENEDGMVVGEVQTGYEINGKVVRPSSVVVNRKVVGSKLPEK